MNSSLLGNGSTENDKSTQLTEPNDGWRTQTRYSSRSTRNNDRDVERVSTSTNGSFRNSEDSRRSYGNNEISKPHRRDLSQGPKFNTQTGSPPKEPPTVIKKIIIPEVVQPPIVAKPPSPQGPTYGDIARKAAKNNVSTTKSKQSPDSSIKIVNNKSEKEKWQPSTAEIQLAKDLANMRLKQAQKEKEKWAHHYESELSDMYDTLVDPKLEISYPEFASAAYECTSTSFDTKQLKYTRPLV
ncbi:Hypothetical protein HVR_LOCUS1279 [uncultured virus]|nr:Hypothetical protein HVR_LOCUS1279 [uncultured virus]